MYKNFLKIGWRNIIRGKGYSIINIGGLALGMTVTMFIGLWIHDEISFNKYHPNYDHIGQVWGGGTDPQTQETEGFYAMQYPVATVLRTNYAQYFKQVLMASNVGDHTLTSGADQFNRRGIFLENGAIDMLSLKMLKGDVAALTQPHSIILSQSAAQAIFGSDDPINKVLRIDNRMEVTVTGVYETIPSNNRFSEVQFIAPWSLWVLSNEWVQNAEADWDNRPFSIYVQIQPTTSFEAVNVAIKNLYFKHVPADLFKTIEKYQPFVQVIPMSTWHLYSEFDNGVPTGGRITFVWLFGAIGVFVLLLACINFVNLSTARSEKRAREVGVRKVVGSQRTQLVVQFMCESFLMVVLAFFLCLVLVTLLHERFNILADKDIALPLDNPGFWFIAGAFVFITAFVAGIYPAFYLSSFQPVKVLKGALFPGRFAADARKVLVIAQFTVSVVLIIGTIAVFQQIRFAQNRPIGYDRQNLITVPLNPSDYDGRFDALKTELMASGVVTDVASSSSPLTEVWNVTGGYDWPGRDPNFDADFAICNITPEFGRTVGWEFVSGRDLSAELATDLTNAVIINEAAVNYMGITEPVVGKLLTDVDEFGAPKWSKVIVGVVKDLVMESPYEPVRQTLYFFHPERSFSQLHLRLNPASSASEALKKIESVFKKVSPSAFFTYKFVDQQYATKFSQEQQIGKLSVVFSILAIFISCIGLFGLASFVAEQRTKEIGIRKVLGASVGHLWRMLSKEFIILVVVACLIALPISYLLMNQWLGTYDYRTELSWWIFAISCLGAVVITFLTVSYQAVKAAIMDPVKSLRAE